jgi:hypothetical protein
MTTFNASSSSGLRSALSSARSGDTIVLARGDYGSLNLEGRDFSSQVTIRSADGQAVFDGLYLKNVSGLAFDNVTFEGVTSGYGQGIGVKLSSSEDISIENSTITGFLKGVQVWDVDDLRLVNNDLTNIGYDAMVMGHVHGALIQGNDVSLRVSNLDGHSDGLQFYNEGPVAPSSDIVIRNNSFSAADGKTHGIYMGNNDAQGGSHSEFYKNILIEGNTVRTGQVLGIAVGEADGVTIRNNVVFQNANVDSSRAASIPVIRVQHESSDVSITGNTTYKQPAAAGDDNWQPTSGTPGGWTIANNSMVSLGNEGSGGGGGGSPNPAPPGLGDGDADNFRFDGDNVRGATYGRANIDFTEGDKLVLVDYDTGTFRQVSDGNFVWLAHSGEDTIINSLADIREIDRASGRVSTTTNDGALVLHIEQNSGVHHITLVGLAESYLA